MHIKLYKHSLFASGIFQKDSFKGSLFYKSKMKILFKKFKEIVSSESDKTSHFLQSTSISLKPAKNSRAIPRQKLRR